MLFWIIAAALAFAVAGLIAATALRARAADEPGGADVAVYRAQLAEVDRDLARGVIREDEAARLSNEISRRLLAADAEAQGAAATARRSSPLALAGLGLVLVAGSLGLYAVLGAPGYPDLPLAERLARADERAANRPGQAEAEAEVPPRPAPEVDADFAALMDKLRTAVAERPDDVQGLRLLARNEATLGNFAAAHAAQARVVEALGDGARAQDYLALGEMMVLAAGGYVSPEAEAALNAALARAPDNGAALYYIALSRWQTGRPDLAFRIWEALLRRGPEDAPWIAPIRAQIGDAARLAGMPYDPPAAAPAPRGPSAEDVEAASEMSDEDRAEMIRGMVSGLSDRLATEGGPPQDWARLIGAYGVLGELERARAIHAEALEIFAGDEQALALIREAGTRAGVDG